jgi:hypothetical protein
MYWAIVSTNGIEDDAGITKRDFPLAAARALNAGPGAVNLGIPENFAISAFSVVLVADAKAEVLSTLVTE